jgi:hypothetical protein
MRGKPFVGTLALAVSVMSVALLAPVGGGCDDGGTGGGDECAQETNDQGCFNYDCHEQTPDRSFRNDVLPVFEQSCALSAACHGNPSSPTTTLGYQPYLGEVDPDVTPSDVDEILSLIVGQESPAASMPIVDPGKPETSFLMHKMDGTLECADLTCTDCGDTMPQGGSILNRETRDIIRDWILQGAPDN